MPTKFIQAGPNPFLSGAHPGNASIGFDTDTNSLVVVGPGMAASAAIVASGSFTIGVDLRSTSVDATIYTADRAYQVTRVTEVHSVAGAGSSTLDVEKCTGTTAPGSGTTMLATVFALDSTVNTVVNKTLTSTAADLVLAAGDRIAIDLTGTISSLVGRLEITLKAV